MLIGSRVWGVNRLISGRGSVAATGGFAQCSERVNTIYTFDMQFSVCFKH